MNDIILNFKKSIDNNPYNIIKNSMLYCSNYISPAIIEKCLSLKQVYDSYHLYKVIPFYCISNSFIYAYLHYILLFDHSFVTTSYKRNNVVKISKLKDDTINNILYLYCKQISLYELQNNVLNNVERYQYDINYVIETIQSLQEHFSINMNQRINIMIHSNDNKSITKHENIIFDNLYKAYYTTIEKLGKHLITENACLTGESP